MSTAVLVLLCERDGHGYDLAGRLTDLGFDPLDTGGLYRTLRALEADGFVRSSWDGSDRGPARRVYQVTRSGRCHLAWAISALAEEARLLEASWTGSAPRSRGEELPRSAENRARR